MGMPDKKKLDQMRKKLAKAEGFQMLDPNADELARFRFQLCQELLKHAQKNALNTTEMAKMIGVTKADMSRIFNHRIERFSTDKLVTLFAKINPDYRLKVS